MLATNLVSALEMDHLDIFLLAHRNILLELLLTAQSNTNSNQSATTFTDSTAEQVPPDPEHLQLAVGPTQDTSITVDNVLTQDY